MCDTTTYRLVGVFNPDHNDLPTLRLHVTKVEPVVTMAGIDLTEQPLGNMVLQLPVEVAEQFNNELARLDKQQATSKKEG